uniref:Uncharacterized protein n=1 Tax=viral metagenome TaxID=1070528 RepID=A0A6M3LU98_9ZZZZ
MSLSVRQQNTDGLRCYAIYRDDRLVCTFAPWISKEVVFATKDTIETFSSIGKRVR